VQKMQISEYGDLTIKFNREVVYEPEIVKEYMPDYVPFEVSTEITEEEFADVYHTVLDELGVERGDYASAEYTYYSYIETKRNSGRSLKVENSGRKLSGEETWERSVNYELGIRDRIKVELANDVAKGIDNFDMSYDIVSVSDTEINL
jgi:lantibiotic modifying enzyme